MTTKQSTFIRTLIAEKAIGSLTTEQRAYLARIQGDEVDPTVAQASRIIEALLALAPVAGRGGSLGALPAVNVPAGRYALDSDDGVKFYIVDRPTEGRWAGRTFVSALASDEKYPIRNAESRAAILAAIAEDPHGAMIRFGHEIGCCGRCGRTLTDETSREMGIGPECAKILGIDRVVDRTPKARTEEAAPAAPPTGDPRDDEDRSEPYSTPASEMNICGSDYGAFAAPVDPAERAEFEAAVERDTTPRSREPRLTWRETAAAVAAQQGRTGGARGRRTTSQLDTLPGTTWEDIFGMGS